LKGIKAEGVKSVIYSVNEATQLQRGEKPQKQSTKLLCSRNQLNKESAVWERAALWNLGAWCRTHWCQQKSRSPPWTLDQAFVSL